MKIDLHRHFSGSIQPELVHELMPVGDLTLQEIEKRIIFSNGDKFGFDSFFSKFDIFNEIEWTEQKISRCIKQIVWDLAAERIEYAEIHFSIDKYLNSMSWTPKEALRFISRELSEVGDWWGVQVESILSLKYETDKEKQKEISKIIEDPDVLDCVVGLDLVGNEDFFDFEFYAPIFKQWKQAGKGLIAHAGESGSPENVKNAIVELGVDRIAHGIRIIDDKDVISIAKDHDIYFDIALTSNIMTRVVRDISEHPVSTMLSEGCKINIGTDDPVICGTTLDKEYGILSKVFGIKTDQLLEIMENSIMSAFALDPSIKSKIQR